MCATVLAAVSVFVSGCQAPYRMADKRFMTHPEEHRRVQVLPVWFEAAGKTDRTMTTNDLARLRAQTGEALCAALGNALSAKGYQVVGALRISPGPGEVVLLDPIATNQLLAVREEFSQDLLRHYLVAPGTPLKFWTNRVDSSSGCRGTNAAGTVRREDSPFHHQLKPAFTNLLPRIGATNAEAVLLVDTRAYFQSPHQHVKANRWNYSAGALLAVTEVAANLAALAGSGMGGPSYQPLWIDPFWRPRNSIRHIFALVDTRSGQVLWFNRQDFDAQDPRSAKVLAQTVDVTLGDLPSAEPGW